MSNQLPPWGMAAVFFRKLNTANKLTMYMMSENFIERRKFLRNVCGGISLMALDWSLLPRGLGAQSRSDSFDAIIIGSGLGGLSCAAAFARQGFRPLVLEQHNRPGGYATTFKRPGGFVFDVSLHSTAVGDREGLHNLIPGFPEITDVEFLPHPSLYRSIYPDHDLQVPQQDLPGYIRMLVGYFPGEEEGIRGIFEDMEGLYADVRKLSSAEGEIEMSRFPVDFPYLFKCYTKTWGEMVDDRITDPKLKAMISSQWGYYGLPPSKLSSFYYALPALGYLTQGGYYPVGKSQKISNALVSFIEERGGEVKLNTRVKEILTRDRAAYGVRTDKGEEFTGKVVVSNANAHDTFNKMLGQEEYMNDYLSKMRSYSVSLSSFQIFLGLKRDIVSNSGITDSEIFMETGYDIEQAYRNSLNADVEDGGYALTLYDNILEGYSPEGKNTLNIMTLQGYEHWEPYAADYFSNDKSAYRKEKERMADILITKVEETLLPGLRDAIEVKEIGTPLTNIRYTSNYRGAIYGFDQTLNNSGQSRIGHSTPVQNLYLSGAWSKPGHGYGGVLGSGLQCFGEIMQQWQG
jgi:phytoene dehydrogenase-like protein